MGAMRVVDEPWFRAPEPLDGVALLPAVGRRLDAATGAVAFVVAPGGYGKTTQVAHWASSQTRPLAWMTLEVADDDPSRLVAAVASLLGSVTDIDVAALPERWGPPELTTVVVPLLGALLDATTRPFVLVLDDVHVLASDGASDVLDVLCRHVPAGSTVVLLGRSAPRLAVGSLRARPGLLEVGVADLGLPVDEAGELLARLGVHLDLDQVTRLRDHTEGWPVGLRLAALMVRDRGDANAAVDEFTGRDRFVADYLHDEWLGELPPDEERFLLDVAHLDWFSGELCDAVLERQGSGALLAHLHRRASLLVPLDRRGEWYRLHHLLADALRAEQQRRDPSAARAVHLRASAWFEEHQQPGPAIDHALAAGDLDRAAALIVAHAGGFVTSGHHLTVQRWLAAFPFPFVADRPWLALHGVAATVGLADLASARQWLRVCVDAVQRGVPLDDETRGRVAFMRSLLEPAPSAAEGELAASAYELVGPGPFHASAAWHYGEFLLLTGRRSEAERVLLETEAEARLTGAPTMEANAAAVLALAAALAGDWPSAARANARAQSVRRTWHLDVLPGTLLAPAVDALVRAHDGDVRGTRTAAATARRELSLFEDMASWANLLARLALARAYVLVGDRAAARTIVGEARRYLGPETAYARDHLADLEEAVRDAEQASSVGPSSLTTAELRVLHHLPTNLQLGDIARRLFVSRNTVKTHAISIYRKLGVSSRGEAVEVARRIGLLERADAPR